VEIEFGGDADEVPVLLVGAVLSKPQGEGGLGRLYDVNVPRGLIGDGKDYNKAIGTLWPQKQ
jgi:hypothetical protein